MRSLFTCRLAAPTPHTTGRTSLVIVHRLSIIRSADRIIVLEKWRTVEAGPHDSLLAAGGGYADLVAFPQRATPL